MDVARPILDRLHNDGVGELDHRGFLAGRRGRVLIQAVDLVLDDLGVFLGLLLGLLLGLGHDFLQAGALGFEIVELVDDRLLGGDHRNDLKPRQALDVIQRQHVQRVGHGQKQLVVQPGDRDHFVRFGRVFLHQVGHFHRDGNALQIHRRHVEHAPHGDNHVHVLHELLLGKQLQQAGAFLLLQFEQLFHLLGRKKTVLDQGVGDAFSKILDRRHRKGGLAE